MRLACLAFGLGLLAQIGLAQEIEVEAHRFYEGTSDSVVRVISTADLDVFEPFLLEFQRTRPAIGIDYTVTSSTELHRAMTQDHTFDLAISSAMDLQFKLANDGFAQSYRSSATDSLPAWASWRNLIFAFTSEPAVVVISRDDFVRQPKPVTRQDLIALLRENPARFQGRVGTYDVRVSGLGYLFATQEARASDAYWRLTEVMGRLDPQLYCCSAQMIDDVASGKLALAYNVLGSYAAQRIAEDDRLEILVLEDFSNVMLRTAIIPQSAQNVEYAGALLDDLLRAGMRDTPSAWVLPPLSDRRDPLPAAFGPIRLGPGLMVNLDQLNRRAFLDAWESGMEQR
ncbi:MAG: ABC transporter substrate-binding protein [Yoonia sp.]|uniref:ABC transporter substrate-binding protein n=1 Tax=Yoonia sp. TaxID=2212373 RepID=UPI00273DA165|nr:ABC transporter substrate-binding protein [Yoonia sp.]MDP5085632.1 ABC transporter substrate-binding protein [Yoonia sp.]MDP5361990.1 ABC transporter substrate-binding protein [Paracoccaceae bacterium]